jgi:hypothetical protein
MNIKYDEDQVKKIYVQSLYAQSATATEKLGTVRMMGDGDEWVYCKNGAVALAPGKLIQSVAADATKWSNLACDIPVVGANVITVTLGTGGDLTANEFAEGYIHVNDDTGEGFVYKIYSHPAAAAAAACAITIYGSIQTTFVAATTCTITRSPYSAVIVTAGSAVPTAKVVGVPQINVTIGYYFWAKKKGICPVLAAGTLVVAKVCVPTTDAIPGGVDPWVLAEAAPPTGHDVQQIGVVAQINADTEYGLVFLNL